MNRQRTVWGTACGMIAGVTMATWSLSADATEEKHLQADYTASTATELILDVKVGTIYFERTQGDVISVNVRAYQDDSSFFKKKGRVSDAELVAHQNGNELKLKIKNDDDIKVDWYIKVPQIQSLVTDLGVGSIDGELWTSSMVIDVGVGAVNLELFGDYGTIKTDVGVGDSKIKGTGQIENNRFLMTAKSRASSTGAALISISTGVGDINLTIE